MNQMPQATAIQIESRQPTTAEILAYAASRHNKWFSPQGRPSKSAEPKEQAVTRIYMTAPTERVWARQHDSHVRAFYDLKGNPALAFLKQRCRELCISYEAIVGPRKTRDLVRQRERIIGEIHVRFPHLSFPELGRMFNRDHTTIMAALRRVGIDGPKKPPIGYHVETIRGLFEAKESTRVIAKAVGYDHKTVANYVKRMGWTR